MGERESRRCSGVADRWGEGERDGTSDREEGLADMSGSHRGVSGKKNGLKICHILK